MLAVGINPVSFVHRSVIQSNNMEAAEKAQRDKEREICRAEIKALDDAIAAIDASKPTARATLTQKTREIAEKKKSCTL